MPWKKPLTAEQKEKQKASYRKYRLANLAKVAEATRKRRAKDPVARAKHAERTRQWRLKNPDKYRAIVERSKIAYRADPSEHRAYILLRDYGLTMERYFEMLAGQEGKCKLCREPFGESKGRKPAVDHCHRTGKVRGILHSNCNIAIGMLRDDAGVCAMAAEYLREAEAKEQPALKVVL